MRRWREGRKGTKVQERERVNGEKAWKTDEGEEGGTGEWAEKQREAGLSVTTRRGRGGNQRNVRRKAGNPRGLLVHCLPSERGRVLFDILLEGLFVPRNQQGLVSCGAEKGKRGEVREAGRTSEMPCIM